MQTGEVFVCMLRGDDEQDSAALVFDFECAVRLAGALLMESSESIDDILAKRDMSADMLDATSEVGNTLASVFNKVAGNRHVRAAKVAPADDAARAFIGTASARQCYRYSPGGLMGLCAH
jgi:hypothetical protein